MTCTVIYYIGTALIGLLFILCFSLAITLAGYIMWSAWELITMIKWKKDGESKEERNINERQS